MFKVRDTIIFLQSTLVFVITAVVLAGTGAPIVFQLCFNRDVLTGASFFNGILVPFVFSLLVLLLCVYWPSGSIVQRTTRPSGPAVRKRQTLNYPAGPAVLRTASHLKCQLSGWFCFIVTIIHLILFYSYLSFTESLYCIVCMALWCLWSKRIRTFEFPISKTGALPLGYTPKRATK